MPHARLLRCLSASILAVLTCAGVPPGLPAVGHAQVPAPLLYDQGSPTLTDLWVDPVNGDDSRPGTTRGTALRTLAEAWARVPQGTTFTTTGYRIRLAAGDYPESFLPGYMESRHGTFQYPVVIESADGPLSARLHGYLNIFDTRYLYLIGLDIVTDPGYGGGGNAIHVEQGDHILLHRVRLSGFDGTRNQPQETLKVNQSQHLYVEHSDIGGATWFALDFVAVQHGHIVGNRIHHAGDDGLVLKGGTAYLRVDGNVVHDCGVVGITAGQGTGFEFMVSPWIHYEAYDLKITNNVIRETQNAGLAVRGGYNILMAYNTLYRVGLSTTSGGPLLLVAHGERSCDQDAAACLARHTLGGWGPTVVGAAATPIPNRNVFAYNNIFWNPAPAQTRWGHFDIAGPATAAAGTNVTNPVRADDGARIRGNLIWDGPADHPLGIEDPGAGCQPGHPTCNATQLRADNGIHTAEPELYAPAAGDFHPTADGNVIQATTFVMPDFAGGDRPSPPLPPEGNLDNTVAADLDRVGRSVAGPPGALLPPDPVAPASPPKLVFIHHSTGSNWLADSHGNLGIGLRDAGYFVSDTNYGWGPGQIGDHTDIGHWYDWFVGPASATALPALYAESGQHSGYSRLADDPGGENRIILFKSCYPNSHIGGSPDDPPTAGENPLRGEGAWSSHMTVANVKGLYNDLLAYFVTRPDKLFVVVTAPPLVAGATDGAHAANARAVHDWLVHDWLRGYPLANVAVFDFYNVLTSNGGTPQVTDAGASGGNHHRWWLGGVQHQHATDRDVAAYPASAGDSHPNAIGGQKATTEFVPWLNAAANRWLGSSTIVERLDFSAAPVSGLAPLDVAFTARPTGNATAFAWIFGDGGTSTERDPRHVYTAPGTYTVSLSATFPGGQKTTTKADYITAADAFTFVAPVAGDAWTAGARRVIRWQYSGAPGPLVALDLVQAGDVVRTIVAQTAVGRRGTGSRAWVVPCDLISGHDYAVRIRSLSHPAYTAQSAPFRIDGLDLTLVVPRGGETWHPGDRRRLRWQYRGCPGPLALDLLHGGVPVAALTPGTGPGAGRSGGWAWRIPADLPPGDDYRIRATSTSFPGLSAESATFSLAPR